MQSSKERCNTLNEHTIEKVVNKDVEDYINKTEQVIKNSITSESELHIFRII